MSKKFITILFSISIIIFLLLSFYLVQNNTITMLLRNIIFGVLIVLYLLAANFLVKDKKKNWKIYRKNRVLVSNQYSIFLLQIIM